MKRYIKSNDNKTLYPYTLQMLKSDNPGTVFSKPLDKMNQDVLAAFDVFEVYILEASPSDSQNVNRHSVPSINNGLWELGFDLIDKSTEQVQSEIDALCIKRKKEVDALRDEKVYTDIDADFNGTPGVIQFRDLEDRLNLTNVTQGAQANIAAGNPSAIMIYRDKSNYRHSVTSVEMLGIGATALAGKQAIAEVAWDHKDAIKMLTSASEIESYDITVGWPS